jgi:hypothetical protein
VKTGPYHPKPVCFPIRMKSEVQLLPGPPSGL